MGDNLGVLSLVAAKGQDRHMRVVLTSLQIAQVLANLPAFAADRAQMLKHQVEGFLDHSAPNVVSQPPVVNELRLRRA